MPQPFAGLLTFYRNFWNVYQLDEKAKWQVWDSSRSDIQKLEKVSLIVLEKHDSATLNAFVAAIKQQSWLPDEVIFVRTSASAASEKSIKETWQSNFSCPIQILDASGGSLGAARNQGIEAASHPIVVITESDCMPEPQWLQGLLTPLLHDPALAFSLGQVLGVTEAFSALEFFYKTKDKPFGGYHFAFEKSLALRKIWWARVGGYPEDVPLFTDAVLFAERLVEREIEFAYNHNAKVHWKLASSPFSAWKLACQTAMGEGGIGLFAPVIWKQVKYFLGAGFLGLLFLLLLGLNDKIGFVPAGVSLVGFVAWMLIWGRAVIQDEDAGAPRISTKVWPVPLLAVSRFLSYLWGVRRRASALENLNQQAERHLMKIVSAHPDRKGVILYFPTHDWGYMFQRPHQIARHFARAGYLFFYGTRNELSDAVAEFHRVEPNLYLVSMPAIPPETFRSVEPLILYIGAAWFAPYLNWYEGALSIYDHYDDLKVSMAKVEDHEALLERADIVLASSQELYGTVAQKRPDVLFVPNAVDDQWVQSYRPKPGELPPADMASILQKGKPVIGYSGALAEWFDYPLLKKVCEGHPEWEFILIGVSYDHSLEQSHILELPNLHWLGPKPYQQLFSYVWRFDVAIIPFQVNEITFATSPIKLFEYFACRKPVVTTPLPECMRYQEVLIGETPEAFGVQIQSALSLASSPEYQQAVQQIAQGNTWKQRIDTIVSRLDEIEHSEVGGRV